MIDLQQIADLDGRSVFLPEDQFRPYVDLDGRAAAAFLAANGARKVAHRDLGTNGLAIAELEHGFALLSTNGCYSFQSQLTPAAARLLEIANQENAQ